MRIAGFGRYELGCCMAVAVLAGCGAPATSLPRAPMTASQNASHVAYKVLHSFGGPEDGETPFAPLTELGGTLYGTTIFGGQGDWGTVFSLTPRGKETVLHNFGYGAGDGQQPYAGLLNVNGTLYGTTWIGGTNTDGTVFSITRSGKESVLHSFGGSGDGIEPYAGLINVKGVLYGTTYSGGTNNAGTVFSFTRSGTETVLHSFGGSGDGDSPYAGLLSAPGKMYGTTEYGGDADGEGTIFSISASGKEAVLHSFGPYFYGDGERPYAGLVNVKGTLYGTTERGGAYNNGAVFSITASGKETVVHSFATAGDGTQPNAGLVNMHGTLYGTTSLGGANGDGTVFAITTSGSESILHSFGGSGDGSMPQDALLDVNGTLYGTTEQGGAHGDGTVFSIRP